MTAVNFCYWLQGYFEIAGIKQGVGCTLNNEQVAMVQRHLALVFRHDIDPKAGGAEVQEELNKIHGMMSSPFKAPIVRC